MAQRAAARPQEYFCQRCRQTKSVNDFYSGTIYHEDGQDCVCNYCHHAEALRVQTDKACHRCKIVKPPSDFEPLEHTRDGLTASCAACLQEEEDQRRLVELREQLHVQQIVQALVPRGPPGLQDYARALVLEWSSHIKVCIEADQGEKEAENQVYDGPALDEPAAVLARVISEVIVALGADPTPLPRPVGAAPVAPPSLFFLSNTLENLKPQMEREAKWMEFGSFAEERLQKSGRCHEAVIYRAFRKHARYSAKGLYTDYELRKMVLRWYPSAILTPPPVCFWSNLAVLKQ